MKCARFAPLLCAWALLAAWHDAIGQQPLQDPTRPPPSVAAREPAEKDVRTPVLQSIVIRRDRRVAIISGQEVVQGGKFGDAVVDKITETEVVLRSGTQRRVLQLYPDVNMSNKEPTTPPRRERERR